MNPTEEALVPDKPWDITKESIKSRIQRIIENPIEDPTKDFHENRKVKTKMIDCPYLACYGTIVQDKYAKNIFFCDTCHKNVRIPTFQQKR